MYGQFLVTTLSKLCVELVSTMPFIHSTKNRLCEYYVPGTVARTQAKCKQDRCNPCLYVLTF